MTEHTPTRHTPTGAPLCIAHRGASARAPENTLSAFRLAVEEGATWIELDVHAHGDGAARCAVVIHDETLDRTTDGAGSIHERALAQLQACDAGGGDHVPTLGEVLDALAESGVGLNVELKGVGSAGPAVAAILRAIEGGGWTLARFVLSSFREDELVEARRLAPALPRGVLCGAVDRHAWASAARVAAATLHPDWRALDAETVAEAHEQGLRVFAYTLNDEAAFAAASALGVDGIITDDPARMLRWVNAHF